MTDQWVNKEGGESWDQWNARREYQESHRNKTLEPIWFDNDTNEKMSAWCELSHPKKHYKGWEWNKETKQWKYKGE